MALLVVGGSGRGAGKTAVGCALMAALPELRWVGVKISPHGHEVDGVWIESDRHSEKDTGRYLRAGAEKACLISDADRDGWEKRLADLRTDGLSIMVESNQAGRIMAAEGAMVSLAVLSGPVADWKSSLWSWVEAVDALVLSGGMRVDELPTELRHKLVFGLEEGLWVSAELVGFVSRGLVGE